MLFLQEVFMEAICMADFNLRRVAKLLLNEPAEMFVDGFHDGDGIWFFGEIKDIIRSISQERFGVPITNQMQVYLDSHPDDIAEGVHNISVYGLPCHLYNWQPQSSFRGLVILASDNEFKEIAKDRLKTFFQIL